MARDLRTPQQNSRIWAIISQLVRASGMSREEWAELLAGHCGAVSGQSHSSKLTRGQADEVIRRLQLQLDEYAERPAPTPKHSGAAPAKGRNDAITPFQQHLISQLFALCGMDTPEQRRAFTERQVKRPWPQTQADADKLVQPLSSMAIRKLDGIALLRRVEALAADVARLDRWKQGFVIDLLEQVRTQDTKTITAGKLAKLIECELAAERARSAA